MEQLVSMNNDVTKIVLKLIKDHQITPEEGAQIIKAMTPTKTKAAQDIAVIGMSGVFPDADNVEQYWTNLAAGKNSVREIPESRFLLDSYYDPDPEVPNKSYSKWAGLIDDIDKFDPAFFKISPREAELMDPQQRLFLQEAWRALEDAGYSPDSLDGQKCGVFVGCSTGDYQHLFPNNQIYPQAYSLLGNITSVLAARISYLLNLKGPSIAVDTACSSSLVALHLACESIRNGTSDMALAGGVMVYPTPYSFIWASKMGILSPQGRCRTFDQHANGIAIGECSAAVILKPLKAALKAGDNILGVVKGSGINQDGNTDPGITAPSASAQAALETEVYQKYNINPETITYVEAHGTGTKLGDPIEIDGLTQAFNAYTEKKQYCAIGSVKTNIGHTQIAAGVAGFIKLLLCLRHKKLVPSLHLEKENEHLNFPDTPFYVNTALKDWETEQGVPRRAALSSFGFSGTNSHFVLEEYSPKRAAKEVDNQTDQLIILSAANEDRLKAYAKKIRDFLNDSDKTTFSLTNFAYTLQVGRETLGERLAILANNIDTVITVLTQYIEGETSFNGLYLGNVKRDKAQLALLYEGKDKNAELANIVRDKKLADIADSWVLGAKIDWQSLYEGERKQRLSLPTYPFAKKSYWIPINEKQPQKAVATQSQPLLTDKNAIWYYQTTWQQQALDNRSLTKPTGTVLLFDLSDARHANFKSAFNDDVILVIPGENYRQLDTQTYAINPNHLADYYQLLSVLPQAPSHIIHLWSQSRFNSASLNAQIEISLYSVFYLTQALLASHPKNPIQLLYAYLANLEEAQPHYAAISGFAKTVHQENPKLNYKVVALSSLENISQVALAEFHTTDAQVHYEKEQRWVKQLQAVNTPAQITTPTLLKQGGVYLITGGAGGLGLVFAEYLAKHFKAKLILTGRSDLSQERAEKINHLNALEAEVIYKKADVSKRIDVEMLITEIKLEFGTLNGVIHSAGIINNALISQKSIEDFEKVLSPKVYGTTYLDEATQDDPLDFFILFSSVISMMDNVGQSDYAYANAFLDNFAAKREKLRAAKKRAGKTLCINWPLWQQGGMQVDSQTEKWLASAMGMLAISNETGIQAFLQGLNADHSQFIVIEGDQKKINKAFGMTVNEAPIITEKSTTSQVEKPAQVITSSANTISTEQLQQVILDVVATTLKVNQNDIDVNEDVSQYGADSIMTIMIVNQINEKYELELSATLFFDHPTIHQAVQFLCEEYPDRFGSQIVTTATTQETTTISSNELKQSLLTIVSETLKINTADIDLDEDISQYGADSIMAIMIVNQVNEKYELELSATLFFDNPSINAVTQFLCEAHSELFGDQTIEVIPAQEATSTISSIELQQSLVNIVSTTLKIDESEIDVDEDVSQYGADSIMAIMIVNQVNEKYELELSATLFFDNPSISAVTQFLCEEHPELFGDQVTEIVPIQEEVASTISSTELQQSLVEIISTTLKIDESEIDSDEEVSNYGADSIMAIMIVNQINEKYELDLSATLLFDHPTINQAVQFLCKEYPTLFGDQITEAKPVQEIISTISSTELQQSLVNIISTTLKIDESDIDVDEEVSNYGADSIMAIMIVNQVNEKYELDLSATLLFDHPTINQAVQFLCEEHPELFGDQITEATPVQEIIPTISSTELQQTIHTIVASTLYVSESDLDVNEDISQYGADFGIINSIVQQVNEKYDLDFSAIEFFDYPSISAFAQALCDTYPERFDSNIEPETQQYDDLHEEIVLEDVFDEPFPLSYDQQAQWFSQQKDRTTSAYNLSISQRICSPLDIDVLRQSFQFIIDRHALLRGVFVMQEDGQLMQRIRQQQAIPFKVIDASGWSEEELQQKVIEADQLPFDLAKGPLFRIHLFCHGEQDYVLLITMHHIIFDGWSGAIVINELDKIYPAILAGQTPDLPVLKHDYKDYIDWYNHLLASDKAEKQWQYWQQQLGGELPVLALPTDYERPPVPTLKGDIHFFQLDDTLIKQLKSLALAEGTTLYSLLLTVFKLFLHDATGQDEVIVGSPFANRNSHKLTGIVGDLVNMVPLRSHLDDQVDFSTLLGQVSNTIQDALRHSEYPFQLLVQKLQPKRVAGYSPLFQVVFVLQKPLFKNSPWLTMDPTVDSFDWAGLETKSFIIPTAAGRFDLLMEMVELENTLVSWLNYNSDLFSADTIANMVDRFTAFLKAIVQHPKHALKDLRTVVQAQDTTSEKVIEQKQTIAVSATFTAEPLKDSLYFWMQQLNIPTKVSFAPFNQVFQQLLDPASLLVSNQQGINLLLIRFEDWVERKDIENGLQPIEVKAKIEQNVHDLANILRGVVQNATVPYLLSICPASPAMADYYTFFQQMEDTLEDNLKDSNSLYIIKSEEWLNRYPVSGFYDAHSDKEGRVPYTPSFFTAMSTLMSRKYYTLQQKPYKVIVLDCDNTIWKGVCGEDGALGIKITEPFQALQNFVLEQQAAGVLLCLCSKNVEEDVFAVFDQRDDMLIKREHLVSWRINWQPKSDNLKSLAKELNLGLDSFIFIDDNPVECAEVQANCPEVLTLQVPENTDTISTFLKNVWAFDRLKVTAEDRKRTAFYQQNVQREQLRQQSMTLEDFLESLGIQIDITTMKPEQISRVSQMTQRTNQFNATTVRRSESEIQQITQSGDYHCLVVEVKDRFGDYGIVGLMIYTVANDVLDVDSFLVSCRVLGRGVEHNMLARLGKIAQQQGLTGVQVNYTTTAKNKPIRNFLEKVAFEMPKDPETGFWFPTEFCKAITYQPVAEEQSTTAKSSSPAQTQTVQANSGLLHRIATELANPEDVLQLLEAEKQVITTRQQPIVAPRNDTETKLVELWKKVLHIQSVSIHDNFFEFGGDSLLAVKLMFYIQQTFDIELPLSQLLNAPTVAELAQLLEQGQPQTDKIVVEVSKQPALDTQDAYPLSHGQQALWFLYQTDKDSAAYNVALPLRIRSNINIPMLQNAFQALVNRHPCLRTTFSEHDGQALQKVNQYQIMPFEWIDAASWSEEELQDYVVNAYQKPFDLENGSPLRVHLLTRPNNETILLLTIHHIVVDGWSIWMLVEELGQLYTLIKDNRQPILSTLTYSYADFVNWQNQLLNSKGELLWAYWQNQLAGELPVLQLPTDYPRPNVQSYQGASVHFVITNPLLSQLKQFAQNEKVSFYTLLLAAYQVLLYRYSGQEDILVGSPTTGRTQKEFSDIVGYFVNMVVLRAKFAENLTISDFLKQVQQTVIAALEHQDYPFVRLVERLQPERDPSRSPIFQVDFAFQQLQQGNNLDLFSSTEAKFGMKAGELEFETFEMGQQEGLFDLTLDLIETKESLIGTIMYSTDLFKESTIKRMVEHFKVLLKGIMSNATQPVTTLPILTQTEQQQLLHDWNNSDINYPQEHCVQQLFENHVTQTPDAVAVMFEGKSLTYRLLNEKANQLAHHLQHLGVQPETVVGLCMQRSLEMVVGLLGILKAGGAYLPLDPHHPIDRIQFMLQDARASILLTQSHLQAQFAQLDANVIDLDNLVLSQPITNPVHNLNSDNLAYIIYTSGSTGKPKGVMLNHQGLINHNQAISKAYQLTPNDHCLQFANVNFDVATEEIFSTLSSGATLVMSPAEGFGSFADFQTFIDDKQLTVLNLPASYWHEWVLHLSDVPESLRLIVVGSEKVSLASLKTWAKIDTNQKVKWFNAYGPTEATITTTLYQPNFAQLDNVASVPIGQPIANTQIYILDNHLQPVPIGVPGELHIGGVGLAKGYLNNPTLTAEKFIVDPFVSDSQARLYKTGDLVRYLPDGNIEYLERFDHQVKIRGFRIEIGEIEAVLMQHPDVQDTLVDVYENQSGKYLVAYLVPTHRQWLQEQSWQVTLAEELTAKLPDYMVPKTFIALETMPLTPNGKIDRKALPKPNVRKGTDYIAPRSEVEQQLVTIWAEVLKQEKVGIRDNFFELGGDSIRSLQIVAKAKELGLFIKTNDIFQHQTIAKLAAVVQQDTVVQVDQGLVTGKVPLIPIQQAFFARELPQPWHYNQFFLLESFKALNTDHLQQAFSALLLHHDALRLRYDQEANQWQQFCDTPTDDVPFFVETLTDVPEADQLQRVKELSAHYQASLNLEKGQLSCLVVFKLSDSIRVLWCIHHLLVDGVSWRILLEDLETAYQQITQRQLVELPQKTSSFKAWAESLQHYTQSEVLTKQANYWQEVTAHSFTLPLDYPEGINTIASTKEYVASLDDVETAVLLKEAASAYNTRINDLLLTALAQTFNEWTGQQACLIELESHGRAELFKEIDISRTVGWFTAIYPVKLSLSSAEDLGHHIQAVKQQLQQVSDEGISYGLLNPTTSTGQVLFNYLGQFDQDTQAGTFQAVTDDDAFGLSQSQQGHRDYILEINSIVRDGSLYFYWSYSHHLYNQATIQRLAEQYIEKLKMLITHCQTMLQQNRMEPASLLLPIRAEGEKSPFFCLAGMQGMPRYLYPLAHQLDEAQPFYSLYAPEIVGQIACTTVEELAARYIAAIKTVQLHGPYQIGGHSFGGAVAFEMASQLEKANEEVSLVVLLDEPAPVENAVTEEKTLLDYLNWLAYFNNIAQYTGDLTRYSDDKQLELAVEYLNQAGLALDKQEFETTMHAFTNNYKCYNHYMPKDKISSRVVLIQSEEQETAEVGLGWQPYVTQTIEIHKVSGGHFSMLAMPHVKEMISVMTEILE